jgi:hypothetical protein
MFESERGRNFKKCRVRIPISDEIANCGQAIRDCVFGNHFAVYANAFAKGHEVRRREQTGAITLCPQDRIDHCANGTFAIGPSHMDDSGAAKIDMKRSDEPLDIFQPKFDPEALEAIEPSERFFIRQGRSRHFPPLRDHVHGATAK